MLYDEIELRPGRRLGLRPTDPQRLANTIRLPLRAVPPHPPVADHLGQVAAWNGATNQRFGTCGPVSVANLAILTWKYLLGVDVTVSDAAIFDLYRRSGNPSFDPASGAGDDGVDMTVMLSALLSGGIELTHADGGTETIRPVCFAAYDPASLDDIRAVTDIFGGTLWGANLAVAQQAQTDTIPRLWDYVAGSPLWGGHAVVGGAYTSNGAPGQADETVISWQLPVGTTDAFAGRQLQEVYCVVFRPVWDSPGFDTAVDKAQLAADYTAVTGKPFPLPIPAPPAPVPPPAPAPVPPAPVPPPPAPVPLIADQILADAAHPWLEHYHEGRNRAMANALLLWLQAKGL